MKKYIQTPNSTPRSMPYYPTVDSVVGAAGKIKTPMSWKKLTQIAYDDAYLKKHTKEVARYRRKRIKNSV